MWCRKIAAKNERYHREAILVASNYIIAIIKINRIVAKIFEKQIRFSSI